MKQNYIVIDDDYNSVVKTRSVADGFHDLHFVGYAANYDDGLDLILQQQPDIVFLEINPSKSYSKLSLHLVSDLHRFLKKIPKIIVTSKDSEFVLDALRYEVLDYFVKPIQAKDLRKALFRFEKNIESAAPTIDGVKLAPEICAPAAKLPIKISHSESDKIIEAPEKLIPEPAEANAAPEEIQIVNNVSTPEKPLIICVKSYGDYRFIEARNICYLQADNNSTDIHLLNGEMITAFKTLKHFENILQSPFVRIHNSYIVNIDYVSRIHTGNSVCYIKNTTNKLPFSKSYKENVDAILSSISNGNYLEI